MGSILAIICMALAVVLVGVDVFLALRPKPTNGAGVEGLATETSLGDIAKSLAEKSPRLAAALAFAILAGMLSGLLAISASAGS